MKPGIALCSLCLLVSGIIFAACTSTVPYGDTGSVHVTSSPPGAEIYLDNEYRGTTPAAVTGVFTGNHTLEIRERGYEHWSARISVMKGSNATITATLMSIPTTLPVTFATVNPPAAPRRDLPRIHVDGYWTYPPVIGSTVPAAVLVHTDAFNVGYAGAREVTVSANLYYEGRQICWDTIYLGTLEPGGHVAKDSLVSCTLPSNLNSQDMVIRFENVVVTP